MINNFTLSVLCYIVLTLGAMCTMVHVLSACIHNLQNATISMATVFRYPLEPTYITFNN